MSKRQHKKYIFRWKNCGIEVKPSWSYSEEETWKFAIDQLRPATMKDDAEAEAFIREHGEVVELAED